MHAMRTLFLSLSSSSEMSVTGDALAVAKCNLNLRTADRVYISLKDGVVKSFDELFAFVKSYRWEEIFSKNAKIIVDGKCVKSTLFAISACQSVIKKAIVERLKDKYKINSLSETGEAYFVDFYIFKEKNKIFSFLFSYFIYSFIRIYFTFFYNFVVFFRIF